MKDVQELILQLKDKNPDKRYEACEYLRVAKKPLPREALDALLMATKDSHSDVADAAQRALTIHTSNEVASDQLWKVDNENVYNIPKINVYASLFGGFVTSGIMYFFIGYQSSFINDILCLGTPIAILGGFAGYWKNKDTKGQSPLRALFVASIIGIIVGIVGHTGLFILMLFMGLSS